MNVLFVSISSLPHVNEHGISLDLLREFRKNGHKVFIVCAIEKRDNKDTHLSEEDGCAILRVRIGNNKRAGLLEKGLTTVLLPRYYIAAIKKYYSGVQFDLVLYPTPPVTHVKTVEFVKKRDGAKSYLLLKDIFPQNAVDIGMMSKTGIKGILYRHFRRTEKKLYRISDHIGCMSEANVSYLLAHNPEIDPEKAEVCPNSIEIVDKRVNEETKKAIRAKYGIPPDQTAFIYGGNLGKPQGIPFLIECLKKASQIDGAFFLIVGDGNEYGRLEEYAKTAKQDRVKLIKRLPKDEYDALVAACDTGLIFLDHRFTIPNFPSRLLGYLQAGIPVLACTDPHTDLGEKITEGGFGWWCESNSSDVFCETVSRICGGEHAEMRENAFAYLAAHYAAGTSYQTIIKHFETERTGC